MNKSLLAITLLAVFLSISSEAARPRSAVEVRNAFKKNRLGNKSNLGLMSTDLARTQKAMAKASNDSILAPAKDITKAMTKMAESYNATTSKPTEKLFYIKHNSTEIGLSKVAESTPNKGLLIKGFDAKSPRVGDLIEVVFSPQGPTDMTNKARPVVVKEVVASGADFVRIVATNNKDLVLEITNYDARPDRPASIVVNHLVDPKQGIIGKLERYESIIK